MSRPTPQTVLPHLRAMLASASERRIVAKYGDRLPARLCLPESVEQNDLADVLFCLDALITGTERDYIATDRETATRQICELDEQSVRDLLVDLLARPRAGGAA